MWSGPPRNPDTKRSEDPQTAPSRSAEYKGEGSNKSPFVRPRNFSSTPVPSAVVGPSLQAPFSGLPQQLPSSSGSVQYPPIVHYQDPRLSSQGPVAQPPHQGPAAIAVQSQQPPDQMAVAGILPNLLQGPALGSTFRHEEPASLFAGASLSSLSGFGAASEPRDSPAVQVAKELVRRMQLAQNLPQGTSLPSSPIRTPSLLTSAAMDLSRLGTLQAQPHLPAQATSMEPSNPAHLLFGSLAQHRPATTSQGLDRMPSISMDVANALSSIHNNSLGAQQAMPGMSELHRIASTLEAGRSAIPLRTPSLQAIGSMNRDDIPAAGSLGAKRTFSSFSDSQTSGLLSASSLPSAPGSPDRQSPTGSDHAQPRKKRLRSQTLSAKDAIEIYNLRPSSLPPGATSVNRAAELAHKYGVATNTIRDIWNRRSWAKTTRPYWTQKEESEYKGLHVQVQTYASLFQDRS